MKSSIRGGIPSPCPNVATCLFFAEIEEGREDSDWRRERQENDGDGLGQGERSVASAESNQVGNCRRH